MSPSNEYLVETRNLVKRFGSIVALRSVNFRVGYGEVVGLVGDNGAGKSTLVKLITGFYEPDEGEIIIKGRVFKKLTPIMARRLGIEIVHQERTLAELHPVWRNMFMGREIRGRLGFLKIGEMKRKAEEVLRSIKFTAEVSSDTPVYSLSGGLKQGVQIGRAFLFNADLVILDEPTNALSLSETKALLDYVDNLRRNGKSCVFISHNIHHVYPVADRFTIMDRGRVIGVFRKSDLSIEELTELMISIARTGMVPPEFRERNMVDTT